MTSEIREFIARSDYYRGSVQELAKLLPADDAVLDGLINETLAENDAVAFVFVTMAALCAERSVQARHLARGLRLMPEKFTLGTIASHMNKHCCVHKDQERLHHPTDIAGLTVAELRANPEPYLTALDFHTRPAHEIARFDPLKIAPDLLEDYLASLCRAKQVDAGVAALEKLGYRDDLNSAFNGMLLRAAQVQRKDLVDRMLKLPPDLSKVRSDAVHLFLDDGDPAKLVAYLQEEAVILVAHNQLHFLKAFPRMLLKSRLCALGILVARGAIPLLPPADAAALLNELLETHDRLGLSTDDPISDVVDRLSVEQRDEGKDAAALREAQSQLQAKMQEVRQYREAVERLEKQLARRERPAAELTAPAAPAAPADEAAVKEMRQKVNALKAALKERHNERNELRRNLQEAQADLELLRQKTVVPAAPADTAEEADAEEDLLLPQEGDGNQPIRLVEFPHGFQQTLERVPRHVARGALSMLGRLAGGEPAAFVGAVRLKACPSITRQRIGIDHRLLFRLLPERVQVVDLIPRQDLERRIKTLV